MLIICPDDALRWHPRLGIHASNVAPEFGVTETLSLIKILEENNQQKQLMNFSAYLFNLIIGKMDGKDSKADDRQKAIIGGHYVFGTNKFMEIKRRLP